MRLTAFISDHGFGHASRSAAVLIKLLEKGFILQIITAVPDWFFQDKFGSFYKSCTFVNKKVDIGLSQTNSIEPDYSSTLNDLKRHWENVPTLISELSSLVNNFNPQAVFFDITALAPLVANKCQIPSFGMGNFSWDWIYQDLITGVCQYSENKISENLKLSFQKYVDLHKEAYEKATHLFELPYSGDFSSFSCSKTETPWVGHHADEKDRIKTLNKLELDPNKKFVLYSFGGHDLPIDDTSMWEIPDEWEIIIVGHYPAFHPSLHCWSNAEIFAKGVKYTDLVSAVDVVATKPGYGIITDCIFNNTPMIHVERGQFAEYPYLIKALAENLPNKKVDIKKIKNAEIFDIAEELISRRAKPAYSLNGAQFTADKLETFMKTGL